MHIAPRWSALTFVVVSLVGCGDNLTAAPDAGIPDAPPPLRCGEEQLVEMLEELTSVTKVREGECGEAVVGSARCFEVDIAQPFDHRSPDGRQLTQHLFLAHRGCDNPMLIADWGYANDSFFDDELSVLYRTNTLWIEHRFQGGSVPASEAWDWRALTIENGAGDMHRVIEAFRPLYQSRWVSTGASKGGITAAYHAYLFPDDLDGTVPYVAPASRARIDHQYQGYLSSALPAPCAPGVRAVQVAALTSRRTMLLAKLTELGARGFEDLILEQMTATFDWGFWQVRGTEYCADVPTASSSDDEFWSFYADATGIGPLVGPAGSTEDLSYGALSYEWLTEQGFALQIGEHVQGMLVDPYATATMEESFQAEFPDVDLPAYDGTLTAAVRTWARESAQDLLLIYGELDPWSGAALDAPTHPSSARFFVPGANHGARLTALPTAERDAALAIASRMFGREPVLDMESARRAAATRQAVLDRQARVRLASQLRRIARR